AAAQFLTSISANSRTVLCRQAGPLRLADRYPLLPLSRQPDVAQRRQASLTVLVPLAAPQRNAARPAPPLTSGGISGGPRPLGLRSCNMLLSRASAISLLGLAGLYAQSNLDQQISGQVTDASGAVLRGATVTATDQNTGLVRTVKSNQDGHYVVPNLP